MRSGSCFRREGLNYFRLIANSNAECHWLEDGCTPGSLGSSRSIRGDGSRGPSKWQYLDGRVNSRVSSSDGIDRINGGSSTTPVPKSRRDGGPLGRDRRPSVRHHRGRRRRHRRPFVTLYRSSSVRHVARPGTLETHHVTGTVSPSSVSPSVPRDPVRSQRLVNVTSIFRSQRLRYSGTLSRELQDE